MSFTTTEIIEAEVIKGEQGYRYVCGPYRSMWYRTEAEMNKAMGARFPKSKVVEMTNEIVSARRK